MQEKSAASGETFQESSGHFVRLLVYFLLKVRFYGTPRLRLERPMVWPRVCPPGWGDGKVRLFGTIAAGINSSYGAPWSPHR
jgi:hypothetical protein